MFVAYAVGSALSLGYLAGVDGADADAPHFGGGFDDGGAADGFF